MSEERSNLDKGKQVVRRAGKAVTTVTGTLSGKNVEEQIAEYSETYTQVLLGLHQDIEAQGRRLQNHQSEIEALKRQAATIRRVRILAIAALVMAVASAGGALWPAL